MFKWIAGLFGHRCVSNIVLVKNLNKHQRANSNYHCLEVMLEGKRNHLMLTTRELQSAFHRAEKNPEDIPSSLK